MNKVFSTSKRRKKWLSDALHYESSVQFQISGTVTTLLFACITPSTPDSSQVSDSHLQAQEAPEGDLEGQPKKRRYELFLKLQQRKEVMVMCVNLRGN